MRTTLLGGLAAITLVLAGCGGSDGVPLAASTDTPATAPTPTEAQAQAPPAGGVVTSIGESSLGAVLVGDDGRTLYGFTNDTAAASTCYGTCADAWPPVIVSEDFAVAPALDVGIFATTVRDDGSLQLVAGKWPLYYFAGDVVPGDVQGQGSGDVWFAVNTAGTLVTGDVAAEASTPADGSDGANDGAALISVAAVDEFGEVLVDADGLSLYGFTDDVDGVPSCADACADAWPPVVVDSSALPSGLDPAIFSVVERADGRFQLRSGVWPLYRFAGDAGPGDTNGQGSGDVWFLADPSGGLVRGADAPAQPDASDEGLGY